PDTAPSVISALLARTLHRARPGTGPLGLQSIVIAVFPLENIPIQRLQHLVHQAVHRLAEQIAKIGALPRHDVQHLGQLTVAGDVRRVELEPVRALALATPSPGAGCEAGSGAARGSDAGAPGAVVGAASPGLPFVGAASPGLPFAGAAGAGRFSGIPRRCRNSAIQPLTGLSSPVSCW